MPTEEQVRERVKVALVACNLETVTIDDHLKGKIAVTLQTDRYDFEPTHLNTPALKALDTAVVEFSAGRITEADVKEAIRVFRDASECAYYDGAIRIREPKQSDFDRLCLLFKTVPGERTVPSCRDEAARQRYLLDKITAVFDLHLESREYGVDGQGGRNINGDLIVRLQKQFLTTLRNAVKNSVPLSEQQRDLDTKYRNFDFTENRRPTKELKTIPIEDAVLERDYDDDPREHTHQCGVCVSQYQCFIDHSVTAEVIVMICDPCDLKATVAEVVAETKTDEIDFSFDDTPTIVNESERVTVSEQILVDPQIDTVKIITDTDDGVAVTGTMKASAVIEQRAVSIQMDIEADAPQPENLLQTAEPAAILQSDAEDTSNLPVVWIGERVEKTIGAVEEALTEEEAALAAAVEADDEEEEDDEPEQGGLFGDISVEKVVRSKMFTADQVIDAAFQFHREEGFPYRNVSPAMAMKELQDLANTEGKLLINTRLCYQIADTFHKHRFHAAANGMSSPYDSFNDDKKLRKAIRLEYKLAKKPRVFAGGMMTLVNGTQACSNFRPGFASYLYREYAPDDAVVLDTSTGYGGRLLGAIASQKVKKYIGIDPNVPTYKANIEMIEKLHLRTLCDFTLYNLPAEDVPLEPLIETCDFSFTSPPYFAKEIYSQDETQSWKRYGTGDAWRDGFLKRMLELTYSSLKFDTFAIVNIAPVKVKNKTYPLDKWTIELGVECGFTYLRTDQFPMMTRFGKGMADEIATEPVIIFRKEKK